MDLALRELYISRICSGSVRCSVDGRVILVRRPTADRLYVAQEIYQGVLEDAQMDGLFSEEGLYDFLIEHGHWDGERQRLLDALPKEIDEFKVSLVQTILRASERKRIREALAIAKHKLQELMEARNAHSFLSCSGSASLARNRYLMGASLYHVDGQPFFKSDDFWEASGEILDRVLAIYTRARLDDVTFRELSRTDPWRLMWNARKVEASVFGVPVTQYTEEQKTIVNWSLLYDSVFAHPECPSDEVVNDDDILDGWMIIQRRKREQQMNKNTADDIIGNDKIKNSDEVYIVAENKDEARQVHSLNDDHGKHTARQRFAKLASGKVVSEVDMPDTQQRLRMELTQRLSQTMSTRKG